MSKERDSTRKRGIYEEGDKVDFDSIEDLEIFDGKEQDHEEDSSVPTEKPVFFGIIDRQELEYFKQAERTLNANAFGSDEEKSGFIEGVVDEMTGKELKVVTSDICSKLVERVLLNGTDAHIRKLFNGFNKNFVSLSLHKYASHCLETLLVRLAFMVDREIDGGQLDMEDDIFISAESMVMYINDELRSRALDLLAVHQYGSHVLRMLILVLSGSTIPSPKGKSSLRSNKSKFARKVTDIDLDNTYYDNAYQVPAAFRQARGELARDVASALDTNRARELSSNQISSPVIQLLLKSETEGKRKKGKEPRIGRTIFNGDEREEAFVEFLVSEPVGSHFFEACI